MDTEAYGHDIQMEDMSLSTCCDINRLMKSKGVEAPYPTDYTRRLPMQNQPTNTLTIPDQTAFTSSPTIKDIDYTSPN